MNAPDQSQFNGTWRSSWATCLHRPQCPYCMKPPPLTSADEAVFAEALARGLSPLEALRLTVRLLARTGVRPDGAPALLMSRDWWPLVEGLTEIIDGRAV
jgi:hypothetical protein